MFEKINITKKEHFENCMMMSLQIVVLPVVTPFSLQFTRRQKKTRPENSQKQISPLFMGYLIKISVFILHN
jgi:hypothetical protein